MNEAEWAHAERLAELLLEQLETLRLSEHAEALILATVARRLVQRTVELGEVIEGEARELNDLSALQMATAVQALGPSIDESLGLMTDHGRFGLMPSRQPTRLPAPPPHEQEATGTDNPPAPRQLRAHPRRSRFP